MAINVSCSCGRTFEVPSFMAGQEVSCSKCGLQLFIPKQEALPESLDKGATLRRLRCQKCGNQIKITTGKTFRGVECAACGNMVGLDGSSLVEPAPPKPPPSDPPPAGPAVAEPRPPSGPASPGDDTLRRLASHLQVKPASDSKGKYPSTAFERREREAAAKESAAEPVGAAAPASQVVDCGGCGKMFATTEAKCPFCLTPRGMGTPGRGRRQGKFADDMLMAFAWGARGIFPLLGRYFAMGLLLVGAFVIMILWLSKAPPGLVFTVLGVVYAWYLGHMFAIGFQVIKAGAARMDEFPALPSPFELQGDFIPFAQFAAWWIFTSLPSLLCAYLASKTGSCLFSGAGMVFGLATWPVWFLGYLAIAVHDQLFRVSPVGIVRSIVRMPGPILVLFVTLLMTLAAGAGVIVGSFLIASVAGILGKSPAFGAFLALALSCPVTCYLQAVFWRMLGIFYYHHEDRLTLIRRGE